MTATGTVTIFAVQNISSPVDITAGPDGAMWFTASGNVIGRITTSVTPTISRFIPTSGPAGTTVTITGLNPAGQGQLRRHRRYHRVRHCLWVPRSSSTSRDQAVFADQATGASLSSDPVVPEVDRSG
jgi:hypothetical protein